MSLKIKSGFAYLLLCLGLFACRPAPAPPPTQVLQVTATVQPTQADQTDKSNLPTQRAVSLVHAQPVFNCITAAELPVHSVAAGDTLYNIAARAGMTVAELQEVNCIPPSATRIEIGQQLHVRSLPDPLAIPTSIPYTESMPPVITVVPTMFTLTPEAFTAIPPTATPVVTQPGFTIPPVPTIPNCIPQSTLPVYTVVAGDTLYSIATQAGMAVTELQDANCIPRNSAVIYVGQRLYLRNLPAPQVTPTKGP